MRNLFSHDFVHIKILYKLENQSKIDKKKEMENIRYNYTMCDSAGLEGGERKMLQKSSALLPQVSADGHYQRQDSWLAGPSRLCVIWISQNQTCI